MATLSHFPNALQVRGARQTNFADLHATVSRYGWSAEQAEAFGDLLGREHLLAELQASAIAPDVAGLNVAAFGPGTDRHWEDERAELVAHARLAIQTGSVTSSGHPQAQPGHLADRLIRLDQRYRHLRAGGWRSLSAALPGVPTFDQWKPAQARLRNDRHGAIKYEAPPGFPDGGGLLLPQIPERCWRLICKRNGLPFPDAGTIAAGFWPWALVTPGLRLLITEGWKKALAAVGCGYAAVALPGVQMGRRVRPDRSERLIKALLLLNTSKRRWLIAFDADAKASTAAKVGAAAGALARALRREGGAVEIARLPLLPGTKKTGLDDLLVAAGIEALDRALATTGPRPVLPRLRQPDVVAPAGRWLAEAAPIPPALVAPLVALAAPMGSGKTEAIAAAVALALVEGRPVVLIGHRVSLVGALAERLGIPFADDAAPGSDHRLQGVALCGDSLRPGSAVRFRASDWSGALVVIDEAAQVLHHVLFSDTTAVADHRPEVLEQLQQLLSTAAQVLIADAQLSTPVLQAFEVATGHRAHLISSEHKPAAGRHLISHPSRDSWRHELVTQLQARRRVWVATTAKDERNGSKALEALTLKHWPACRVLRVDSETMNDPDHDASRLAADPNGIAAAYDVVICTPAVAAGLSVDKLPDHFAAVMVIAGGTTDPEAVAQAAARVRDDCPRHLYAPETSPGGALRVGCGSLKAQQVLNHQARHGDAIVAQLAGSLDLETGSLGPWLPLWAELAATTNRQHWAYAATVRGLLEREGYSLIEAGALTPDAQTEAQQIAVQLREISADAQDAADLAVRSAELLSDAEALELQRKRRHSPAQRAQLARWRIAKAWGLGEATPSTAVLEADRQQLSQRLRFGWTLGSLEARQLQARADQATAARLSHQGKAWRPDLCRELVGPRITAADALGLPDWLTRGDWFTAKDPRLLELQARATACRGDLAQVLGVSPGKTGTTTLRRLLRLTGHRLEAERIRNGPDRGDYRYRVVAESLPAGVTVERLQGVWADQLQAETTGMDQKIPFTYGGGLRL